MTNQLIREALHPYPDDLVIVTKVGARRGPDASWNPAFSADELVQAGVRIIFNYSEALLQVPPEVTVHASSPAVDLLYALYFYLA